VPYRGSGPAVIDVAGGRVDIMFDAAPSLLAMIQAGKIRPLAVASRARVPIVPDVPTFDELGISGIDVSLWFGISGPAGLPPTVENRLNSEIAKVLQMPDIKDALVRQGAVPMGGPPDRYNAFIRAEQARWGDIVRKNNIKVE
jgi:tripartite-type tricarboxylate transporter receptor subunit TctC